MISSLVTAMSAPASAALVAAASTSETLPEISPTVGSNCNNAMTVTNGPFAAPHSTLRRWAEGLSSPPEGHGSNSLNARLVRWIWRKSSEFTEQKNPLGVCTLDFSYHCGYALEYPSTGSNVGLSMAKFCHDYVDSSSHFLCTTFDVSNRGDDALVYLLFRNLFSV